MAPADEHVHGTVGGEPEDRDDDHDHDVMQECIEECLNCHAVCTMTAQHALVKGGEYADVNVVGVLLDCAELCQVSANFMLRGSPFHAVTCAACAELCRACEEVCRTVPGDEQMEHCADVCAACADSCEQMAASHVSDEDADG
jgi:hypothetical protein